ncbi:LytS/YhcK type 5TM receptor domain-containing protein [Carnobacterium maltaromaticum]|uniref:sensor histidine kinase n=1 Tax=Carnobacterium maltaromaticum TaxID=2751 RepID=UPI0007051AA6|nr:sensor histidine kinase [Carnobacterium maltaromaticum]KRN74269.1 signal transduction histidine kinase [Carnobacterium maltaromaticum]MBC9809100.1 sensor histidine kinase [Carnobacterium maltaromaticum]CRH18296.1 Sensor protein LytS [Carnobacterium maltaromaticum]
MFSLFIMMMERVGLIILLAYLLVNVTYFKTILLNRERLSSKLQLMAVFGLFAIISNFTGVELTANKIISTDFLTVLSDNASIANTRTLTIGVSGLIGGPFVGLGVGLLAGMHRVIQGGGTSLFYLFSSSFVGILSGLAGTRFARKKQFPSPIQAAGIGALMELVQMLFVFLFSGTLLEGWLLVKFIAFPMILLNSIGTFIFLSIITSTLKQEEQMRAVQTHDVLDLAAKTLPYFREGLTESSCRKVAKIIQQYTKVAAISMTDTHQILAHVGAGSDHHIPELEVITELSKDVLQNGQLAIAKSKNQIGCSNPTCQLSAAIVIPLISKNQVVGTLKMYFTDPTKLTHVEEQLAEGLGTIFSSQLELGEAEIQSKLLKDAEIKSLQAQVNPHFFFNAMNTISALMRQNAEQARTLLLQLSTYFRANLQGARQVLIPLTAELKHVEAYLSLEQARFPQRFQVTFNIDPNLETLLLPPFLLQVLVENAIRHAFGNRKTDNQIVVQLEQKENFVLVQVSDNGIGIPLDRVEKVGKEVIESEKGTGTALENLNKRLVGLFGLEASLQFSQNKTGGTTVLLKIPLDREEG